MLNVSNKFKKAYTDGEGYVYGRVLYNEIEFDWNNDVIDVSIESVLTSSEVPSIGNVCSSKATIKIWDNSKLPNAFITDSFKIYACVELFDGTLEEKLIGIFYPDPSSVVKKEDIVTITAYDIINKLDSEVTVDYVNKTAKNIVDDINANKTTYGITIVNVESIDNTVYADFKGKYKLRNLLEKVALMNGSNVRPYYENENENEIEFCKVTGIATDVISNDCTDTFELKSTASYTIRKIGNVERGTTTNSDGEEIDKPDVYYGTDGGVTIPFSLSDTLDTQEQLKNIFVQCYPLSFYAYELTLACVTPYVQIGDVLEYTDSDGVAYKLQVCNHKLQMGEEYVSIFSCESVDEDSTSVSTSDTSGLSPSQQIKQIEASVIITRQLLADEIEANSGKFQTIEADYANLDKVVSEMGEFKELNAVSAKVDELEAGITKTNKLIFGTADGDTISTNFAETVVSKVNSSVIKNSMIESLSADKIASGTVYTNKVNVQSESGNLAIKDNTMQIADDNNKVRVQIGKDSTNDYSMSVYDKNGKCIWDAKGVTSDGVRDGLITDDMVNGLANINGSKLNIPSVVKEINGSTETIKSSSISYDPTGQSLNIAFQETNNRVDNAQSVANSAQDTANTANDKIDNLQVGGRNLIRMCDIVQGVYNFSAGNPINPATSSTRVRQNIFDGEANTEYTLNAPSGYYMAVQCYDSAKKALYDTTWKTGIFTFKSNTNTKYLVTLFRKSDNTNITPVDISTVKFKLEKGNKATDWTPAPEDVDNNIQNAVDNIQVGGRNLCFNSATWNFCAHQFGAAFSYELLEDTGKASGKTIKITCTKAGNTGFYSFPYGNYTPKSSRQGEVFTYGMDIKASKEISLNIGCENGGREFVKLPTEWTRYTKTFTVSNGTYHAFTFYMDGWNVGDTIYISDFKYEKGNKATDWTSAPEDTQNQIDTSKKLLDDIASDSKLTPSEKQEVKREWIDIDTEYSKYKLQCTNYSVSYDAYKNAYDALNSYLNTTNSGIIFNMNITTDINRDTFNNKFATYYSCKVDMLNALEYAKAKKEADNVIVGGRNIYLGTKDFSGTSWLNLGAYVDDGTYLGLKVKKRSGQWVRLCQYFSAKAGETFTYSAYVKTDSNAGLWFYRSQSSSGEGLNTEIIQNNIPSKTTEWKRVSCTFKVNEDTDYVFAGIENISENSSFWICGIKLEKGNRATDWTPSPEDVDNTLSTLQTDFKVANGKLTSVMAETQRKFETSNILKKNLISGTLKFTEEWLNSGEFARYATDYGNFTVMCTQTKEVGLYKKCEVYKDETYTFSAYVMCTGTPNIYTLIGGESSTTTVDNDNKQQASVSSSWTRISHTFKANGDGYVCPRVVNKSTDTSSVMYVCGYKLEIGDKATGYNQSQNDVDETVISTSTKVSSLIQDVSEFKTTVSETYSTVSDNENIYKTISSSMTQTSDEIKIAFNNASSYADEKLNGVNKNLEQINSYITFDENGMEIGKTGSPFKTKFTNDEVGFYDGEDKAAYINNNSLYIPEKIEVQGTMTVGNPVDYHYFDWKVRENGHFSLMYRGGDN